MSTSNQTHWHEIDLSEDLELPEIKYEPKYQPPATTSATAPPPAKDWPLAASVSEPTLPRYSATCTPHTSNSNSHSKPTPSIPSTKPSLHDFWLRIRVVFWTVLGFILLFTVVIWGIILWAWHFDAGEMVAEYNSLPANQTSSPDGVVTGKLKASGFGAPRASSRIVAVTVTKSAAGGVATGR